MSSADLTPTVLDLLGVDAPPGIDGRSLRQLLRESEPEGGADLYAENLYLQRRFKWSEVRAIRSGSLKLIDKARPELYDLTQDPGESHDLSATRPDIVASLARRLRTWQDALSAQAPREGQPAQMRAEVRASLRSLGYVADAPDTAKVPSGVSGSDPRDHVALFNCLSTLPAGTTATPRSRRACSEDAGSVDH